MASDRSLGGFCHSWGEDQPKVQKKKQMLEKEGIEFESGGKKIMIKHFIEKKGTNARKVDIKAAKQASKNASRANSNSMSIITTAVDNVTEEVLKQEILQLLQKRAPGKTC